MAQLSPKCKNQHVLFWLLFLTLAVFGQAVQYDYSGEQTPATTAASVPRRTRSTTTTRRPARNPTRIQERLNLFNRTLERMERQIQTILSSVISPARVPAPPGSNNGNVQVNAEMFRRLENEIRALRNQSLNPPNQVPLNNDDNDDNNNDQAGLLHELGYRIDTLNSSLGNQNLESTQRVHQNLANLTEAVIVLLETEREKKRQRIVRELLQAFTSGQNDLVKSLMDELSLANLLDSSMADIVLGMFAQNINNYGKVITFFQSAKKEQYKSGFSSLIDLFHNKVGNSSSSSSPFLSTFLDEPKYLQLVYLAKRDFGTEFKPKFPKMVQNLVWKQKTCIRNLYTNFCLFVDLDEGLKSGGYSVSIKKKPTAAASSGYCDWEILSLSEGASFNIRQRNPGGFLNLHVLQPSVFAGTDAYNAHHLWNIRLRKNAQELTLQTIPGSSDISSYYLCSSGSGGTTHRQVEVSVNPGTGSSCSWFID